MKVTNTTELVKSDPLIGLFDAMNIPAQEKRGQYELNKSDQLPFKYGSRNENAIHMYEKIGIKVIGRTNGDDLFVDVILPEGWKKQYTEHAMWNNLLDDKGRIRATYFYKAAFYDRDAFIYFKTRYDYQCIKYLKHEESGHYETRKVKTLNTENNPTSNGRYFYTDDRGFEFVSEENKYIEVEEKFWVPKFKDKYEEYNNTPHYFNILDGDKVIFSTESNPRFLKLKYEESKHKSWWKKYEKMGENVRNSAIGHLNVCFPDWQDITKYWD